MLSLQAPNTPGKKTGVALDTILSSPSTRHNSVFSSEHYSRSTHHTDSPKVNESFNSIYSGSSTPKTPTRSTDRFVPNRANIDYDFCNHLLNKPDVDENEDAAGTTSSQKKLNEELQTLGKARAGKRVVDCFEGKNSNDTIRREHEPVLKIKSLLKLSAVTDNIVRPTSSSTRRIISQVPKKVLDAPDLMNDYYLNLLHWGSNGVLAVALNQVVYLWHAADGRIDQLAELEGDDYVSSVQWSNTQDNTIAIGSSNNTVQLWDTERLCMVREMRGHSNRVSSLAWNDSILSSGSRDHMIMNHDVRERRHLISTFAGHDQEVCGLAWSHDGTTLASGGNENKLCLWDAAMSGALSRASAAGGGRRGLAPSSANTFSPRLTIDEHVAAVKAVAWCPWQRNVLATGGGTADRTIRIWNTGTAFSLGAAGGGSASTAAGAVAASGTRGSSLLKCVNTGSQVCAIQWSDTHKELVSSHGFSDNQLILWKYSTMTRLQEFRGHTARVLHLAKSPCGQTICSASADETLRFWDIFNPSPSSRRSSLGGIRMSSVGSGSAQRRSSLPLSADLNNNTPAAATAGSGIINNNNSSSSTQSATRRRESAGSTSAGSAVERTKKRQSSSCGRGSYGGGSAGDSAKGGLGPGSIGLKEPGVYMSGMSMTLR